jgi:hypothetical protein
MEAAGEAERRKPRRWYKQAVILAYDSKPRLPPQDLIPRRNGMVRTEEKHPPMMREAKSARRQAVQLPPREPGTGEKEARAGRPTDERDKPAPGGNGDVRESPLVPPCGDLPLIRRSSQKAASHRGDAPHELTGNNPVSRPRPRQRRRLARIFLDTRRGCSIVHVRSTDAHHFTAAAGHGGGFFMGRSNHATPPLFTAASFSTLARE